MTLQPPGQAQHQRDSSARFFARHLGPSGRSSYFTRSAISRHNDPGCLSRRGFVGLRFVVVISDMSSRPG
jgi:hypothetical protein